MKSNIFLLTVALISNSCSNVNENVFHNYDEVRADIISWENIFLCPESDYLVYFYSERCGHCNDIKQDVITFYLEDSFSLYFVCTDYYSQIGPKADLKGIDNIDDFYIFGTPFLLRLIDHIIDSYYVGSEEVKEYISILKK